MCDPLSNDTTLKIRVPKPVTHPHHDPPKKMFWYITTAGQNVVMFVSVSFFFYSSEYKNLNVTFDGPPGHPSAVVCGQWPSKRVDPADIQTHDMVSGCTGMYRT